MITFDSRRKSKIAFGNFWRPLTPFTQVKGEWQMRFFVQCMADMVRHGMAWHGMVWCGVVWCGVVWCGVVWCGVWYGMVWYGLVWYSMVWYGMAWHDMAWYGMIWWGMVWCGVVGYGVVWCGVVCRGVVWCGVVWYGMVWYGMVWYGMVWRLRYIFFTLLSKGRYWFSYKKGTIALPSWNMVWHHFAISVHSLGGLYRNDGNWYLRYFHWQTLPSVWRSNCSICGIAPMRYQLNSYIKSSESLCNIHYLWSLIRLWIMRYIHDNLHCRTKVLYEVVLAKSGTNRHGARWRNVYYEPSCSSAFRKFWLARNVFSHGWRYLHNMLIGFRL